MTAAGSFLPSPLQERLASERRAGNPDINCIFVLKAIFFDIDGTLVSLSTHRIPQSAVDAITQAKRQGVKIFISTGRPFPLIDNIGEIRHLVDGYITTNGAWCFMGDRVISCSPIPQNDAATMVRLADEMNFGTLVVGEKDIIIYNDNGSGEVFRRLLNIRDLKSDVPVGTVLSQRVLQFTPIISMEQEERLKPHLPGCESSRWCPDFADFTARDVNKGKGLLAMIAGLNIGIGETMAFGDGGNDLSIVRTAGIGVAMGNANESLKAVADYVTDTVDDNGISNALHRWVLE